jgi:hypothetical protein
MRTMTTLDTHSGEKFKYNTTVEVKLDKKFVKTVARATELNVIVLHPKRLTEAKFASLNPSKEVSNNDDDA